MNTVESAGYNRIEDVFTSHPAWSDHIGVHYATRGRQTSRTKNIAAAVVCAVAAAFLFVSIQNSSQQASELQQHHVEENKQSDIHEATTTSLYRFGWGLVNPETGIPRVQCGDSVSYGSFGSKILNEIDRFHGSIGQTFTVECPTHCSMAPVSIFGCDKGPYLDESSICKAAIGAGLLTDYESGVVTFTIIDPVKSYDSCRMTGYKVAGDDSKRNQVSIESNDWTFHEWKRASNPARIQRYCGEEWVEQHGEDEPCPATLKRYRQLCKITDGYEHCFGARAFMFVPRADKPDMEPPSGSFVGEMEVTVTAPGDLETPSIACHVTEVKGVVDVTRAVEYHSPIPLGPGSWRVVCSASGANAGQSFPVNRTYLVQSRTAAPKIDPSGGSAAEELQVAVRCALGAKARYTIDGSAPDSSNPAAMAYGGPFRVTQSGTRVRAVCVRPQWADSEEVEAGPFSITAGAPEFDPDGGAFVGARRVRVKVRRPSEQAYCTVDGSEPTGESPRCDGEEGVLVTRDGASVKAFVTGDSVDAGPVETSAAFSIRAFPPAILPGGGRFVDAVEVTLEPHDSEAGEGSGGEEVALFFTLDGSTPSTSSQRYQGPIQLQSSGVVVSAIATGAALAASSPNVSAPFVIASRPPEIEPDGGTFAAPATVSITAPDPDAAIHYTVDGSTPSSSSVTYGGPFRVAHSGAVVRAIAISHGKAASSVASAAPFTIGSPPPEIALAASAGGDGRCVASDSDEDGDAAACSGAVCGSCEQEGEVCWLCAPASSTPACAAPTAEGAHLLHYCAPPPSSADFVGEAFVQIRPLDPASAVYYTTDGSDPSPSALRYHPGGGVRVQHTRTVIKAVAVLPLRRPSLVVSSPPIRIRTAPPLFAPNGGEFLGSASVSLSCATPGASIHYTTDGSEPTTATAVYEPGGVTVARSGAVVRAVAVAGGLEASEEAASAAFVVKAFPPALSPDRGSFTDKALVALTSATPGAALHCTLDGSDPTPDSPVCASPLEVEASGAVVKAIATKEGLSPSDAAASHPYTIETIAPTFSPDGGKFTDAASVVLASGSRGAQIWYTVDGSMPTTQSELYTQAIVVTATGTRIRAVAQVDGKAASEVSESKLFGVSASEVRFAASGTRWHPADSGHSVEGYVEQAVVTMSCDTPDASIHYTVDGSAPSARSPKYTEPGLLLDKYGDVTVRAISVAEGMDPGPVSASRVYDIVQKVAAPTISPKGLQPFTASVTVTIRSSTQGAMIHMTFDGSDPGPASPVYREPFAISHVGTTEVKAIAVKRGRADSDVASSSFDVLEQVRQPSIAPSEGTFTDSAAITIESTTPGAEIRYTTDGTEPNAASPLYRDDGLLLGLGPGGQEASYVVKAMAMKSPEMGDSKVSTSGVLVVQPKVALPVISPASPGPYTDHVEVSIACDTAGATIFYTTNGHDPSLSGSKTRYTGPFQVRKLYPEENTVSAVAEKHGYAPSETVSASFEVQEAACTPTFPTPPGVYLEGVPITIQCSRVDVEEVHYTTDGSDPTADSDVYRGPIPLQPAPGGNVTVKAASFGNHMAPSPVVSSPQYDVRPDPTCKAGEYEPLMAHAATSRLQAGKFAFVSHTCLRCPPGGTSPRESVGVETCIAALGHTGSAGGPFTPCGVGSYKDTEGEGECVKCEELSTTERPGSTGRGDCKALQGAYGEDGGPFALCAPGTFSERLGQQQCTRCPPGGTSFKSGGSSGGGCTALPGWTHATSWDEGPFVQCALGTYKAPYGPAPCKDCPFCSTTVALGATSRRACVADASCEGKGIGWDIGFTVCPVGTWKEWIGNGPCSPCPPDVDLDNPRAWTCKPAAKQAAASR